jgi:hypothetical protein
VVADVDDSGYVTCGTRSSLLLGCVCGRAAWRRRGVRRRALRTGAPMARAHYLIDGYGTSELMVD